MKKYLIVVVICLFLLLIGFYSYYVFGFYISIGRGVRTFTSNTEDKIIVNNKEFVIKGVNLGSGLPGHFATEYAIDEETYKRWFKYIQDMGANTIRVYTILSPEFYNAFYEYNKDNSDPIYLLHGVWVDDYTLNSKIDAFDASFQDKFLSDIKVMIDVIHGRRYIPVNGYYSSGFYTKNISKWVIGYVLGVEWEDTTVAYTDHLYTNLSYHGKYVSTTEDASAFENMLAYVGDQTIEYESNKYGEQRLLAFSNWATTDPFEYSEGVKFLFNKSAKIDVENLVFSDDFIGGTFASYHVYPYYPDYLNYSVDKSEYVDDSGNINTYYSYLKMLNEHHNIPVLISEFGVSTGRGMGQLDENTGYNQGYMTEEEQGETLINLYDIILKVGSAGGIVFTWQDEWFKRTWNTMQNVDLNFTPYWSDVQTNEQYFGLLAFDPGKKESISYVDGDVSEWNEEDVIIKNNESSISMQYDEKYIYFMINTKNYNINKKIYIPIDITPNSGSKVTSISSNTYSRDIDFLIEIDGKDNSRVYVQEYYDALLAVYSEEMYGSSIYFDPPMKNSRDFNTINLILQTSSIDELKEEQFIPAVVYETGKLRYGNGNPSSEDYDSLSDFIINGDHIEMRIPWQLLNFSNPSKMTIHDDYYKHYGIEDMEISEMYIGVGLEDEELISLDRVSLDGWGTNVTYHERLKQSYYILKDYWTSDVE